MSIGLEATDKDLGRIDVAGFSAGIDRIKSEAYAAIGPADFRHLKRIERYVKPRPGFFVSPLGDRLFGWLTAYVALMLILPGPGTNGPPAFGNIVMALGLIEHDSRTTAWGFWLTLAGCLFATAVLGTLGWFGVKALGWVF